MNEIRWAMIGTGDVSHTIAPDFGRAEGARLEAICSRSAASADAFAALHAVPRAFESMDALLAAEGIDAVYIATPHATHRDLALRCLAAGKHVLVEKPMALNADQAAEVFADAARRGLFAMEAMWTSFGPNFHGVLAAVEAGEIGAVRSVRASFGIPFPRGVGSRWSAQMDGSTLLDQGIYPITLAHRILGMPDRIDAVATVEDGVDVTVRITLGYDDGRFAQLAASQVEFIDPSASINGTRGWITMAAPFWAGRPYAVHAGPDSRNLFTPPSRDESASGPGFVPMIGAASQAIGAGLLGHEDRSAEDTLAVFAIMDEVRRQFAVAD